jgi:multiple sugar transport system permease protein
LATAGTAAARLAGAPRPADLRRLHDDAPWRRALLTPTLAVFLALTVLPVANLVAISFFEVRWAEGAATWTPVGLAHYRAIPADNLFVPAIRNTIVFVVVAVAIQMVLGFALALFCSKIVWGRTAYRAIFILPILVPGIVIGAIWKLMYNYDFGIINQGLMLVGLDPHDWLGDPATALLSVIIVDVWHWTPFCFLLLLAGIESLPQDTLEAARIDGASGLQELRWVVLPMLWPTILVTLAFRTIVAFKVFDEVFLLTAGGPGTATEVVSFTIYQRFFTEDRVGYGAALSVVTIFVVALILTLVLAARRRDEVAA